MTLLSRNGKDRTESFADVARAVETLKDRALLLDGEVVAFDRHLVSRFQLLQEGEAPVVYAVFDCLYRDGRDLRDEPLPVRRAALEAAIGHDGPPLRLAAAVGRRVEGLRARREEGLRGDGREEPGRAVPRRALDGVAQGQGAPGRGAGHRRVHRARGIAVPFRRAPARRLRARQARLRREVSAPASRRRRLRRSTAPSVRSCGRRRPSPMRRRSRVRPGWRPGSSRRSPSRNGPRTRSCGSRSFSACATTRSRESASCRRSRVSPRRKAGGRPARGPAPDLQPRQGLLAGRGLHEARPDALLHGGLREAPAVRGRPPPLARALPGRHGGGVLLPEGETARHAGRHADAAHQAREGNDQLRRRRPARDTARAGQPRLHRDPRLERPQGGARASPTGSASTSIRTPGSSPTRRAPACKVKEALDALNLASFPKTSGKKGLHVFVPIRPGPDSDEVREFADRLGHRLAQAFPKELTMETRIAARKGRVYLDPFRNGFAQTVVSPYSVRRAPKAPVSTPLVLVRGEADAEAVRLPHRNFAKRLGEEGSLGRVLRRRSRAAARGERSRRSAGACEPGPALSRTTPQISDWVEPRPPKASGTGATRRRS